jgi:mono/diheme cytochrome c family protein
MSLKLASIAVLTASFILPASGEESASASRGAIRQAQAASDSRGSSEQAGEASKEDSESAIDKAKNAAIEAIDKASMAIKEALDRARQHAGPAIDRAKEKTSKALEKARQATEEVLDEAKNAADEAINAPKESAAGDRGGANTSATSGADEAGETTYFTYCRICHGMGGGPGLLADDLKKAAPDLTEIAKRNGGQFPEEKVSQIIQDGRIGGHGTMRLLSWRSYLRTQHSEEQTDQVIRDLTKYLKEHQVQ